MPSPSSSPGDASPRHSPIYKDLFLLQLGALVFLLDQFSKFLVQEFLRLGEAFPAGGFFRIAHHYNTGSAFGLFQGQNTPLILVSFVGITILVMIYRSQPRPGILLRLSLGLQLGGAAGNLLDRLRLGHVTDFIGIGPWPLFNLADASIVVGILLLIWLFLRPKRVQITDQANADGWEMWRRDGYHPLSGQNSWCPICDGEMFEASHGWRCSSCGVRESIDRLPTNDIALMAHNLPAARILASKGHSEERSDEESGEGSGSLQVGLTSSDPSSRFHRD